MNAPAKETPQAKLELRGLTVGYGGRSVLRGIDLRVPRNSIYAFIGPAGSGKTSLLRTVTLLSVEIDGAQVKGQVLLDGQDLLRSKTERALLRRRVAMVFATPQPLPRSIYENLVFGPRLSGIHDRHTLEQIVERSLRAAQLWDEVKDRLHRSALLLSGGQQQRLCIARGIALGSEVMLLDEPCSGLDPISTEKIEEMMASLKSSMTWIIVTNNVKQAERVSDRTAFFLIGDLVEDGPTRQLFSRPADRRTADYIEGRFG